MTKECPVEILQYAWEFDFVIDLYKRVKPKSVLEIGSLYGGTLYHWLKSGVPDVSILSFDLFATIDFIGAEKLWQSWKKEHQSLTALKLDSTSRSAISAAVNEFPNGIDWLFIDGDHSYEGVREDYNNYFQLLNNNGYCIIHDIVGEQGVAKLWEEINTNQYPTIEICHTKYNLGIGIIQKMGDK